MFKSILVLATYSTAASNPHSATRPATAMTGPRRQEIRRPRACSHKIIPWHRKAKAVPGDMGIYWGPRLVMAQAPLSQDAKPNRPNKVAAIPHPAARRRDITKSSLCCPNGDCAVVFMGCLHSYFFTMLPIQTNPFASACFPGGRPGAQETAVGISPCGGGFYPITHGGEGDIFLAEIVLPEAVRD